MAKLVGDIHELSWNPNRTCVVGAVCAHLVQAEPRKALWRKGVLSPQTRIQKRQWEGGRQGDWPCREADRSTEPHQSPVPATCSLGKVRNLVLRLRFSGLKMKTTLSLQVVEDLVVNARHLRCQTVCGGWQDYSASPTWFQQSQGSCRSQTDPRKDCEDHCRPPQVTLFISFSFCFWNENLYPCLPTVVFCKGSFILQVHGYTEILLQNRLCTWSRWLRGQDLELLIRWYLHEILT